MDNPLEGILTNGVDEEKIRINFMTGKYEGMNVYALEVFVVGEAEPIYGVTVSHNGPHPKLSDVLRISVEPDHKDIVGR